MKTILSCSFAVLFLATALFADPTTGRVVNFSVRAEVVTKPVIQGLVVNGTQVILIRAVGTGLSQFGVSGVLSDPQIVLYDAAGHPVGRSKSVSSLTAAEYALLVDATTKCGAFPLDRNSSDAVILYPLSGPNTFHLRSISTAQGEVLFEAYAVPYAEFDPTTRIIDLIYMDL